MKVSPLLKQIDTKDFLRQYLSACGVEDVDEYLKADLGVCDDPWLYPHMEEGVDRLKKAIDNGEKIGVLQDVDADGSCSATIIFDFIKSISPQQPIFCFIHVGKQHGITQSKEEDIVKGSIDTGIDLLIVPDAGSNNVKEAGILRKHGIDVLVLDHHEIEKNNPNAIVINHHLGEGLNTALSGTGVTYQFVRAYADKYGVDIGDKYLDLVATSIVTDVCDMTSPENFAFVKTGFNNISNPMLQAMFKEFNKRGDNPTGVSWGTGPKINAVFRGNNMDTKVAMFEAMVGNHDIDDAVKLLAEAHKEQANIVKQVVKEITPNLDLSHKVVVGYINEEHKGYTGLIANKLSGEYNKPSLVLREQGEDKFTGSLRSPIDIADKINESGLATCQGHLSASGIYLYRDKLDELIEWFDGLDLSTESIKPVTAILTPNQINLSLCHACGDDMLLWGGSESSGIPQPKFYMCFETVPNMVKVFVKRTKTVKIEFGQTSIMKFMAKQEDVDLLQSKKCQIECIVTLEVNEYNGVESPQAKIESWEIKEVEDKEESWEDWF